MKLKIKKYNHFNLLPKYLSVEYIILWIILILVILVIFLSVWIKRKKIPKLSENKIKEFSKKLSLIKQNPSFKEKIYDSDKLYHKILLEIWYSWTFWEILKLKPLVIDDLNKIWELHKLRNKLAHDFDNHPESFLRDKSKEFEREIEKLLGKLK